MPEIQPEQVLLTRNSKAPVSTSAKEAGQYVANRTTPLIITHNEAPNIGRTLAKLDWAREIVVIDSGSTDGTVELLTRDPRVRLLHRRFDDFAAQCQFGLQSINTEWVLSLDADYLLSDDLVSEIAELVDRPDISGYAVDFTYCIFGHPLRATLYPPRTVLYRAAKACYAMEGHGHRVTIDGRVAQLHGRILHDDRKPLTNWLAAQNRYATIECDHMLSTPWRDRRWADRVRSIVVVAPWLVPLYCLTVNRGLLDGWPGWYYAMQRGIAESILALKLIERRLFARTLKGKQE